MMQKFCHHIGVFAQDAQKLKRFYVNQLDFKPDAEKEVDAKIINRIFGVNSGCRLIRLKLDKIYLELFSLHDFKLKRPSAQTAGYNHWALTVEDRAAFCAKMKQRRVRVIEVARAGHHTYFLVDPEGNRIEIRDNRK